MRIDYCEVCDTRLTEEDFESGKAVRDNSEHVYCASCAPGSQQPASATNIKTGSGRILHRTPARTPTLAAHAVHKNPNTGTGTDSHSSMRSHASAPAKAPVPLVWMLLAVGVSLLALVGVLYGFGVIGPHKPERPPVANASPSPPADPALPPAPVERKPDPPAPPTPVAAETAKPHSMFDEMVNERTRDRNPDLTRTLAAKRLSDAIEFGKMNPQDPWTYLEMLRRVPSNTPMADEAARIIADLKVPVDKTGTPGWRRDWMFVYPDPKTSFMLYDFDGRKNILQTKPGGKDAEFIFHRLLDVPADKPFLTIAVRTEEKGATKVVLEINGKQQALEELKGSAWRGFDLDLSAFKGRTVDVQFRQFVAGAGISSAYWTPPVFRGAHESSATLVGYNPNAAVFSKAKAAAPPPKRPFVAPAAWKEPPTWSKPVNLLALADPKTGAVAGEWTRDENGAIHCNKINFARLAIPYKFPAQYDIKAVFERKAGESDACLILMHGSRPFIWQMGAEGGKTYAITSVGGKKFDSLAVHHPANALKTGQRSTTVVEVRKDRISAYLNGKLVTEWEPDMGELSLEKNWSLPVDKPLGLAAYQAEVVFYSLELVEMK